MFMFNNTMEPHKCFDPKCCNPPHWPKFNGKCPEDMTREEIHEYVKKDDYKSLKTIILYSRGYFDYDIITLYKWLLEKEINKNIIIGFVNALFEMFPQYAKEYMSYAINANSTEIINHINKHYPLTDK